MEGFTTAPFLNLPNEIHIEILKSCTSFKDAVTFAATCQQLHSIWKKHQKAVISHIGGNCIVAFDDALIAVRAISLAERQYQAMAFEADGGPQNSLRPPSKIPIHRLGASSCPPSPDEIVQVFDLKYFVETAIFLGHEQKGIHIFCQQSSSALQLSGPCSHSVDSSQAEISPEEIDFKIYASMYRFFLVSAALSSIYWEPFFTDDPRAVLLRQNFACPSNSGSRRIQPRSLTTGILSYLRQWACYNKKAASRNQLDGIFGELGEYLVERGKREAIWNGIGVPNTQEQHSDRDAPSAGAVQTIMMIISCHELFWCVAQQQLNCAGQSVERHPVFHGIRYKYIPVTFLGIHGALDACIPARSTDLLRHPEIQFITRPVGAGADGRRQLTQVRLLGIFHELLYNDGRNDNRGSDLPYELGFFEYVLRRHFGLRVHFKWGYSHTTYSRYLAHATAFRAVEPFRRNIQDILSGYTL